MIKTLRKISDKLFGAQHDFRVRLYNMLAAAGMFISLITGITGIITNAGSLNIILCIITMMLSAALLCYSFFSGKYKLCYMISVVCIFLGLFPALFFSAGGVHSGMPSFFIFAVLFTVFMLEGKKMIIVTVLEIAVYTSICIFAYFYPGTIKFYNTELDVLIDIIISFIAVSAVLGVIMALHLRMYNRRQRELEDAREQVEEYAKMKSDLFAGMSHEMRTPLTVMSAYAQFIVEQIRESSSAEMPWANDQTLADLATISDEAKRLAEMADGTFKILMDSSALYNTIYKADRKDDVFGMRKKPAVNIGGISMRLIRLLEPVASRKGKKISLITNDNIPEIKGDADALIQLVWNLLQNAITHSDGEIVTMSLDAYESRGVKITIIDDGSGIDHELMPHIFEPGFSLKKSGSGMGLSICRYIARIHGGEITIQNMPGAGVCVTAILFGG